MNRTKLMFAAIAACVALAGCDKKDFNAITGTTSFTSVTLSNNPTSYSIDTGAVNAVGITPVATLEPQNVAVANGTTNMTFTFANPAIAEINSDGNLQGDAFGSTTLTVTYTDVDHNFTTTTLAIPVTVSSDP